MFARYRLIRYRYLPLTADLNPLCISVTFKWRGEGWGNLTRSGRDTHISYHFVYSDESETDGGPTTTACDLSQGKRMRFSMGAASVEAFPHELLVSMPGLSNARSVRSESFSVWQRSFFLRRATSPYARYAPRKICRNMITEAVFDTPI